MTVVIDQLAFDLSDRLQVWVMPGINAQRIQPSFKNQVSKT